MILYLKNGSGIHIKKKNRGKFTAYCGGNVTSACIAKAKASGNPTLVKRATFAANARKWKHLNGGILLKYLIGGYILPLNVLEAISKGSAAGGLLQGFGKVMSKILPEWVLEAGTYVSPLNYAAAISKGSINPKVGEEVISKWHPNLLLIARTGEAVFGGKAIKNTPKAVVNTAAKAGNKTARAYLISKELNKGIKLNTKNGRIEVTGDYFNSPDRWYRVSERPEKIGIEQNGKNVTTSDDSGINGTINGWRESMLSLTGRIVPGKGVNEGYFIFLPRKISLSKHGAAHGNTSQAAKGLIWLGTFAFSDKFPIGIIEGLAPVKIFRGMNKLGKDSRTNFVLLNWEDVPLGARVGFHTGEMPMSNLGWFQKTNKGTYTYEPIVPEKRISYQPKLLKEPPTSLKFFERKPSKITEAEKAGVPKGERNNISQAKSQDTRLASIKWTLNRVINEGFKRPWELYNLRGAFPARKEKFLPHLLRHDIYFDPYMQDLRKNARNTFFGFDRVRLDLNKPKYSVYDEALLAEVQQNVNSLSLLENYLELIPFNIVKKNEGNATVIGKINPNMDTINYIYDIYSRMKALNPNKVNSNIIKQLYDAIYKPTYVVTSNELSPGNAGWHNIPSGRSYVRVTPWTHTDLAKSTVIHEGVSHASDNIIESLGMDKEYEFLKDIADKKSARNNKEARATLWELRNMYILNAKRVSKENGIKNPDYTTLMNLSIDDMAHNPNILKFNPWYLDKVNAYGKNYMKNINSLNPEMKEYYLKEIAKKLILAPSVLPFIYNYYETKKENN